MKIKYFLLLILPGVLIFVVLFNFIGQKGLFGLGPVSDSCVGFKISSDSVDKIFPKRKFSYDGFIRIQYFVPDKPLGKGHKYCLGQDVRRSDKWYFNF